MIEAGKVYLVGAGPGDPGLITARGLEILREADAVVFDRLSSPKLLANARPDAELVDAGKRRDDHRMTQDEINAELIRLAQAGKSVCRLKGGDPFVFGRGGEEALALVEKGLEWEVVPGVASPIAAPAYAGIPITQRGMAASLTIVTGSEDPNKPDSLIDWRALANVGGTLAFVMGWKSMPEIVSALIEHGMDRETPSALVQWGTTTHQKSVTAPLHNIVPIGVEAGIGAPVVLVVGHVASLRDELKWFDSRPLFGRKVLVTRARTQASRLANALEAFGAETSQFPAIEVVPVKDPGPLDKGLKQLRHYDWVAFTSGNAVKAVWDRLEALNLDSRAFHNAKIAAVGPSTSRALAAIGIRADLVPDRFDADALVEKFEEQKTTPSRLLFPRSAIGREALPTRLREMGVVVDEVTAYETKMPETSGADARAAYAAGVDITTFTSSSSVKNLVALLGGDSELVNGTLVACMGPITAEAARESGIRVDLVAETQTIDGLVKVIVDAAKAGAWG